MGTQGSRDGLKLQMRQAGDWSPSLGMQSLGLVSLRFWSFRKLKYLVDRGVSPSWVTLTLLSPLFHPEKA